MPRQERLSGDIFPLMPMALLHQVSQWSFSIKYHGASLLLKLFSLQWRKNVGNVSDISLFFTMFNFKGNWIPNLYFVKLRLVGFKKMCFNSDLPIHTPLKSILKKDYIDLLHLFHERRHLYSRLNKNVTTWN